ncbi:MAG TPA: TetR/AcrR family transcriptional regulator [Flavobacteriaceae bacterium]|nr:TetR/AcrR family transcriptional regulator [Flavobacteriaceae bacterium]
MKKNRENLKQDILLAAKSLFQNKGYQKTTMRNIALEVGISATTIYLYYKDKADIMHALHQEGFKILSQQFLTLRYVENPFERLKAMGRVYISFALENRDFYEIMFIMKEPLAHLQQEDTPDSDWEEGLASYEFLLDVVEECQQNGYFQGYNIKNLALMIWANMHGLCALKNNGHLDLVASKVDQDIDVSMVMQQSFDLYTKMIEKL